MRGMPTVPRRVVTGHDDQGESVFLLDGAPPVARTAPDGAYFFELWNTDAVPAAIAATEPERTDRVARMAFILVDGAFTPELVASIGADAAASLLHDPIGDAS